MGHARNCEIVESCGETLFVSLVGTTVLLSVVNWEGEGDSMYVGLCAFEMY